MSLTLAAPGALWLLAVVPLVWVAARFGRTNFNDRQRWLQAVVRSLLLASLALALARPVVSSGSSKNAIVYLVDISHSISSRAITDAAARIDSLNAAVAPDASRIVVFGRATSVLPDTNALRTLAKTEPGREADAVDRGGSDLELALSEARAEMPPG